jgi:2-polyprenyl-6-methoxyphenol hydroxylase-like FAD-dependent oxidoreductase
MGGHALIVGGSLGGLFAAHLLRASGWRVDVFERSAEDLAGRGAGLGTHEALVQVMRRIGVDADTALGVETHSYVWLDARGAIERTLRLPRVMTAWSRIYRPLKAAFPARHFHSGKSFARLEQGDHGVTAVFADGERVSGDLLVAADGARSTVRAQLFPGVRPDYAGYIAWRALVPETSVAPGARDLLFGNNAYCVPDGELAISYPVPAPDGDIRPGRRDYNIVWYRPVDAAMLADLNTDAAGRRHEQIPPPLIRREVTDAAKSDARALLAPQIADIFGAAQPFFQPIYDLTSPQLVTGRVALLGDAAFVARPHVGAGVTKAALDAACLADALAQHADIDGALARYDRSRRVAGDWIVGHARVLGAWISREIAQLSPAERDRRRADMTQTYVKFPNDIREWSMRDAPA